MEEPHDQPQNMAAAGAQVASSFFDSLKSQPILLTLVVMNALTFAFLFYGLTDLSTRRDKQMSDVIDRCLPLMNGPRRDSFVIPNLSVDGEKPVEPTSSPNGEHP